MEKKIDGLEYISSSQGTTMRVTTDWKEIFAAHVINKRHIQNI